MPAIHTQSFGGLIPSGLKKLTRYEGGNVFLHLDTTDHDIELLRSIADACRVDEEFVQQLIAYAELMNRLAEAEREHRFAEIRTLEDEATDLRSELDSRLEWNNLGDDMSVLLTEQVADQLETALGESKKANVEEGSAA